MRHILLGAVALVSLGIGTVGTIKHGAEAYVQGPQAIGHIAPGHDELKWSCKLEIAGMTYIDVKRTWLTCDLSRPFAEPIQHGPLVQMLPQKPD